MVAILLGLKKIVSYMIPIGKTKNFHVRITFEFKNTLLKKRVFKAMSFYRKVKWLVNHSYFSWFEIKAKKNVRRDYAYYTRVIVELFQ